MSVSFIIRVRHICIIVYDPTRILADTPPQRPVTSSEAAASRVSLDHVFSSPTYMMYVCMYVC